MSNLANVLRAKELIVHSGIKDVKEQRFVEMANIVPWDLNKIVILLSCGNEHNDYFTVSRQRKRYRSRHQCRYSKTFKYKLSNAKTH